MKQDDNDHEEKPELINMTDNYEDNKYCYFLFFEHTHQLS